MDFDFSEEQTQLRETLERFLAREYTFERYRAIRASAAGWSRDTWQAFAELGVLAVNVPAQQGGLGFGPLETLALMEAGGAHLLLEPLISSAVIATTLLQSFSDDVAAAELLQQLGTGERIAVLADQDHADHETRADTTSPGYRLNGRKTVILHAGQADVLLVTARTSGQPGDVHGVSLFRVPRDAAGLELQGYPTLGGPPAADVFLRDVDLPADALLGAPGEAGAAIERALDTGLSACCAEAVSVMQALLTATAEYLRNRQQFGQPIGRFQALQHRVADMVIHLEQARSMSYLAAMRCQCDDRDERRRALSAAKVIIGQAGRFIGQQAVQLHGGMGMTDELIVGHYFKRLTAAELSFGDTDFHLQRYAGLSRAAC
jgi:alkylation response protein AidB-like acyl-CoA dehydrogenase